MAILLAGTGALAACGSSSSSGGSSQPPLAGEAQFAFGNDGTVGQRWAAWRDDDRSKARRRTNSREGKADITTARQCPVERPPASRACRSRSAARSCSRWLRRGKLALSPHSPVVAVGSASVGKATLAQVLQHTSGLPDYIKSRKFLTNSSPTRRWNAPRNNSSVTSRTSRWTSKPGSQYGYSDTDNIVAGLVAEHVLAKPYSEILKDPSRHRCSCRTPAFRVRRRFLSGFIHGDTT